MIKQVASTTVDTAMLQKKTATTERLEIRPRARMWTAGVQVQHGGT